MEYMSIWLFCTLARQHQHTWYVVFISSCTTPDPLHLSEEQWLPCSSHSLASVVLWEPLSIIFSRTIYQSSHIKYNWPYYMLYLSGYWLSWYSSPNLLGGLRFKVVAEILRFMCSADDLLTGRYEDATQSLARLRPSSSSTKDINNEVKEIREAILMERKLATTTVWRDIWKGPDLVRINFIFSSPL